MLGQDSPQTNLPELQDTALIEILFEVGPLMPNGESISFQEISAWSRLTGVILSAWESVTLRALSIAYAVQLRKSVSLNEPAPFFNDDRPIEVQRQSVSDKFKSMAKRSKR